MASRSAELLGADGPFGGTLQGFAPRDEQIHMAAAVESALAGGRTLVVVAGTGIGKTLAYLVPALLSGERVIVSTGTKTLQDRDNQLAVREESLNEAEKSIAAKEEETRQAHAGVG